MEANKREEKKKNISPLSECRGQFPPGPFHSSSLSRVPSPTPADQPCSGDDLFLPRFVIVLCSSRLSTTECVMQAIGTQFDTRTTGGWHSGFILHVILFNGRYRHWHFLLREVETPQLESEIAGHSRD